MNKEQVTWYSEWFDSPYYHILYKNHDFSEAELFIDNLVKKINFKNHWKIADIACGRGRHAKYLYDKGFEVVGLDLSPNNIAHANQFANDRLHFFVHDMREVFPDIKFDVVLNLFTSFGYFEQDEQNLLAIKSMSQNLNSKGYFILDFMNTTKVVKNLVAREIKTEQGISFNISRFIENNRIVKQINFTHQEQHFQFEEKVHAIYCEDFLSYFKASSLNLEHIYGNYHLHDYSPENSDRMIFVLTKP